MCPAAATCDNEAKETTVDSLRRAAGRSAAPVFAALCLTATLLLSGCQNFFVCEGKASCPSGGGGSGTTNFAYVSDATNGTTYLAAYDIGNGSLAAISGSPYNLGYTPVAMNVSPNDAFLYVASIPGATNPGIYLYSVNTSGQLSGPSGGGVLISGTIASMDVSPDGNYLFALSTSGTQLTEYQANTSTGALTLVTSVILPGTTCTLAGTPISQTCTVKVAPSGNFVAVALGTAGTMIFPYNSTSGLTSSTPAQIPSGSTQAAPSGDFSVTLDKNDFVYIARTAALAVWQITDASGDATLQSTTAISSSAVPRSVTLNGAGTYVYTANQGAGNISAFGIGSTGSLSAISGSPFTGPPNVSALGVDKTGTYMVAAGYSTSAGVQLFTLGTTGSIALVTSAGTGSSTAYPVVLALTH